MKLVNLVCPLTKERCSHCSMETTTRAYTKVEVDPTTHLFKPVGQGRKKIELVEWCNNDGQHYCKDLAQCPNTIPVTKPLKIPSLGIQNAPKPKVVKKKIKIVKKKAKAVPKKKAKVASPKKKSAAETPKKKARAAQKVTTVNTDLSRWMKPCKKQTNTRKK